MLKVEVRSGSRTWADVVETRLLVDGVEGDEVVWDGWRNPDAPDVGLGEFRFAAVQYEAELARAHHVRLWEWRARAEVCGGYGPCPAGTGRSPAGAWNAPISGR